MWENLHEICVTLQKGFRSYSLDERPLVSLSWFVGVQVCKAVGLTGAGLRRGLVARQCFHVPTFICSAQKCLMWITTLTVRQDVYKGVPVQIVVHSMILMLT